MATSTPTAPLPTIHLNGSGRDRLIAGYTQAWRAMQKAREALADVEFHARDYYVQGDDAYQQARAQRDRQFDDLNRIQRELEAIILHISVGPMGGPTGPPLH
jgi:hypothetical protein